MPTFQFPTNGKVYPKTLYLSLRTALKQVSIPYEREGVSKVRKVAADSSAASMFQFPTSGKVYPKSIMSHLYALTSTSFNSLRAGRCIQRIRPAINVASGATVFQFPTSGKAYPKPSQVDVNAEIAW